jgi:hypothetical protein
MNPTLSQKYSAAQIQHGTDDDDKSAFAFWIACE